MLIVEHESFDTRELAEVHAADLESVGCEPMVFAEGSRWTVRVEHEVEVVPDCWGMYENAPETFLEMLDSISRREDVLVHQAYLRALTYVPDCLLSRQLGCEIIQRLMAILAGGIALESKRREENRADGAVFPSGNDPDEEWMLTQLLPAVYADVGEGVVDDGLELFAATRVIAWLLAANRNVQMVDQFVESAARLRRSLLELSDSYWRRSTDEELKSDDDEEIAWYLRGLAREFDKICAQRIAGFRVPEGDDEQLGEWGDES